MTFPTPRIIVRLFAGQAMDALLQLTYCNLFTKKHEVFLAVPYSTTAISFEDAGRMQCVFYEPDFCNAAENHECFSYTSLHCH